MRSTLDETLVIDVTHAGLEQLGPLAVLLNDYRASHRQPASLPAAEHFLFDRLTRNESMLFLACTRKHGAPTEVPVGFAQVYPMHSGITLNPIWRVSDLYVQPASRGYGVATRLLEHIRAFAREFGCEALEMAITSDNEPAQVLLEAQSYEKDTEHDVYRLRLL